AARQPDLAERKTITKRIDMGAMVEGDTLQHRLQHIAAVMPAMQAKEAAAGKIAVGRTEEIGMEKDGGWSLQSSIDLLCQRRVDRYAGCRSFGLVAAAEGVEEPVVVRRRSRRDRHVVPAARRDGVAAEPARVRAWRIRYDLVDGIGAGDDAHHVV